MAALPTEPLLENLRQRKSFRQSQASLLRSLSCNKPLLQEASLQRVSHGKETGIRLIEIQVEGARATPHPCPACGSEGEEALPPRHARTSCTQPRFPFHRDAQGRHGWPGRRPAMMDRRCPPSSRHSVERWDGCFGIATSASSPHTKKPGARPGSWSFRFRRGQISGWPSRSPA